MKKYLYFLFLLLSACAATEDYVKAKGPTDQREKLGDYNKCMIEGNMIARDFANNLAARDRCMYGKGYNHVCGPEGKICNYF